MKIKEVLGKKILIRIIKSPIRTKSGLYIPELARKERVEGEVMLVSKEVENVSIGDRVIYDQYAGIRVDDDSLLLPVEAIICKVEDDDEGGRNEG